MIGYTHQLSYIADRHRLIRKPVNLANDGASQAVIQQLRCGADVALSFWLGRPTDPNLAEIIRRFGPNDENRRLYTERLI